MKPEKIINPGFFNMELITKICSLKDLTEAKNLANETVDLMTKSSAANKQKAKSVIAKATSIQKLGITLTNFMLAHPSENMKVIK
jgi:hypothetical protein